MNQSFFIRFDSNKKPINSYFLNQFLLTQPNQMPIPSFTKFISKIKSEFYFRFCHYPKIAARPNNGCT